MPGRTAKLFTNGRNQAVRLPKMFEFIGTDEVFIRKEGDSIILTPKRKSWLSFAELPAADDDFMIERADIMDTDRVKF